ncbi:hypothetical protein CTI14_68430, partial [Methylobacterium radiotolerans]
LLKLALPRLVLRAIVIAVALVVWYLVATWILDFPQAFARTAD